MQKFAQRSQISHLASTVSPSGLQARSRQELGNALRVPVKTTTLGKQSARAKDSTVVVPNFVQPAQFSSYSDTHGYQRDPFDTDYAESATTVSEIEAGNYQPHSRDGRTPPHSGDGRDDDEMDGADPKYSVQRQDQELGTVAAHGPEYDDGSDSEDSAVDESDSVLKDMDGVMGQIEAELHGPQASRFSPNTRRFNPPWATKSYPTTTDGELPEEANQFPTTAGVQYVEENAQPLPEPTGQREASLAGDQYALRHTAGLQHREELAKAYHLRQENQLQQQISQPLILQKGTAVLQAEQKLHARVSTPGQRTTSPTNNPVVSQQNPKSQQVNSGHESKSLNHQQDFAPIAMSGLANGGHKLEMINHDRSSAFNAAKARMGDTISHERTSTEKLDYDMQALLAMDYQILKDEPLDKDPQEKYTVLQETKSSVLLPERLSHIAKLSSREQALFFASLSIDEWEESGVWFMQQFSMLKDKMRHSRQERRRIAQGFESEVAARYTTVSKEQQSTEDALRQMKENGRLVVQRGTPKRKRG